MHVSLDHCQLRQTPHPPHAHASTDTQTHAHTMLPEKRNENEQNILFS